MSAKSTTQSQSTRTSKSAARRAATPSHTVRNSSVAAAAGVAAIAGLAYYFRKELLALVGFQKIHVAPHVQANLPIAKDLPTVPDMDGNYDMDGVSFDTEGVIVGSDHSSSLHSSIDPSGDPSGISTATQIDSDFHH